MKKLILFLLSALLFFNLNAQDYTQVYLIGGAAPDTWDNNKAEVMELTSSNEESAIFTWTGPLRASDFKFINQLGSFSPCFNAPTKDEAVILNQTHSLVYNSTGSDDIDHKFVISKAGYYTVTVDLKKLTMVIVEAPMQLPEELWISGTAIPNGLVKLSNAYGIANFIYIGELSTGNFKIRTTESVNEFTQYIVPLEEDMDVTGETVFVITNDAEIAGWSVAVSDLAYKIKVDVISKKLNGGIFIARENLYMVGGAVECGWHAESAIPLVQDVNNPDVFVFDGELKLRPENVESNAFKILGQLNWGPYSVHPYEQGEPVLESKSFRVGGDDNKWIIEENKQGRYIIKINQLYETIEAEYIGGETGVKELASNNPYFQITNLSNGIKINMFADYSADIIQLYNMTGQLIYAIRNAGQEAIIANNVTNGIYILKVDSGKKSFVQRVIIK
jgi:hypothetical protein